MHYLIDTDYVIDFLKGKRSSVDTLTSLFDKGLAISVISLAELYEGIYGSANSERCEEGLKNSKWCDHANYRMKRSAGCFENKGEF